MFKAVAAASFVKKHWKAILAAFLLPFFIIMVIPAAIVTSIMPSKDPTDLLDYVDVGEGISVDASQMVAYDTVRFKNELEGVDPNITAMDFLNVTVREYKREKERVKNEDGTYEWEYYWEYVGQSSYTGMGIHSLVRDFGSNPKKMSAPDIVSFLEAMDGHVKNHRRYDISISRYNLEYLIRYWSDDDREWAMTLAGGPLQEFMGEAYDLPDFIQPPGNDFFTWPVPSLNIITSHYGQRVLNGRSEFHYGMDISGSNAQGQPVISAAAGTVVETNYSNGAAGNNVRISHVDENGYPWSTRYCHLAVIKVSVGDEVQQGDVIGAVGNTGRSTGPHLHLEMKVNGQLVNPYPIIRTSQP